MSRFQISCILAEMAAGLCGDENMGELKSKWGDGDDDDGDDDDADEDEDGDGDHVYVWCDKIGEMMSRWDGTGGG